MDRNDAVLYGIGENDWILITDTERGYQYLRQARKPDEMLDPGIVTAPFQDDRFCADILFDRQTGAECPNRFPAFGYLSAVPAADYLSRPPSRLVGQIRKGATVNVLMSGAGSFADKYDVDDVFLDFQPGNWQVACLVLSHGQPLIGTTVKARKSVAEFIGWLDSLHAAGCKVWVEGGYPKRLLLALDTPAV